MAGKETLSPMQNPENTPTVDQVKLFAKENRVPANNDLIACGDGRYKSEQSRGGIRLFGADTGVLMAILAAANKNSIQITTPDMYRDFKPAVKAVRGEGAEVEYHSKCGHEGKSSDEANEGKYLNLKPQDVRGIHEALKKDPDAHEVHLEGEHAEVGVLIVDNDPDTENPYSVNSQDKDGRMFFVVDAGRNKKYVEDIVAALNVDGITAEDVNEALSAHTGATASLLAAGLERYHVVFDKQGEPQVTLLGKVPAPQG